MNVESTAYLALTIIIFVGAQYVFKACNQQSFLNPVVVSIAVICAALLAFDVDYPSYMKGASAIDIWLGPATVALAVPLYRHRALIQKNAIALLIAVLFSAPVAALSSYILAAMVSDNQSILLSIPSKSVTTAIAIGVTDRIGGIRSLAIFFIFTTGIMGSLVATHLLKLFRITNEKAVGLALGLTCHGLGVARAFQVSKTAGVFSVVGMSLMGIISGVMLPALFLICVGASH